MGTVQISVQGRSLASTTRIATPRRRNAVRWTAGGVERPARNFIARHSGRPSYRLYWKSSGSRAQVEVLPPQALPARWRQWFEKLEGMTALTAGWNGYDAPPPSLAAVQTARLVLAVMRQQGCEPTRIAPSVMGGVGLTRRRGGRKAYVECYNDGSAHALFSDGKGGMRTRPVRPSLGSVFATVEDMKGYLHG